MLHPLRAALVAQRTSFAPSARRNFVSAVLLTKSWDRFTVADLKKEARARGLPSAGTKANLIIRLQEHDKSLSSTASTSQQATPPPPVKGAAPGVPQPPNVPPPANRLNVVLPDLSTEPEETPVQIPYVPDNWTSSQPVEEPTPEEGALPKIVVIAGADTHPGGGPSHNLLDETLTVTHIEATESSPESLSPPGKGGLFDDMAEDMGIPHPTEIKKSLFGFFRSS
ncbi:hypothetical protein K435DRAFT_969045 [Dendrothele bispora CBS 962.96]|uniref:SAP domain-containing protein n=1 Tax=Dendrothele bispora (strain CBS 962.96) TaxID=1314807 RepID=A0A4S8LJZ5_DENBC|nr:hypothetical protein K435DRAFT_969045 [Dendrothele bispora CBS 962.96]